MWVRGKIKYRQNAVLVKIMARNNAKDLEILKYITNANYIAEFTDSKNLFDLPDDKNVSNHYQYCWTTPFISSAL